MFDEPSRRVNKDALGNCNKGTYLNQRLRETPSEALEFVWTQDKGQLRPSQERGREEEMEHSRKSLQHLLTDRIEYLGACSKGMKVQDHWSIKWRNGISDEAWSKTHEAKRARHHNPSYDSESYSKGSHSRYLLRRVWLFVCLRKSLWSLCGWVGRQQTDAWQDSNAGRECRPRWSSRDNDS